MEIQYTDEMKEPGININQDYRNAPYFQMTDHTNSHVLWFPYQESVKKKLLLRMKLVCLISVC